MKGKLAQARGCQSRLDVRRATLHVMARGPDPTADVVHGLRVTQPSRAAAARSRGADRLARAARPPRGAPRSGACSDSGGPGRCAARAEDGVRPPGGRETSAERREQPSCTSEGTDSRADIRDGAGLGQAGRGCRGQEGSSQPLAHARRSAPRGRTAANRLMHMRLARPLSYDTE